MYINISTHLIFLKITFPLLNFIHLPYRTQKKYRTFCEIYVRKSIKHCSFPNVSLSTLGVDALLPLLSFRASMNCISFLCMRKLARNAGYKSPAERWATRAVDTLNCSFEQDVSIPPQAGLVWPRLAYPHRPFRRLASTPLASPGLASPIHPSPRLAYPPLTSPRLALPSPQLPSPHLASPLLPSPPFTTPHLASP